jgi:hypothetical protein
MNSNLFRVLAFTAALSAACMSVAVAAPVIDTSFDQDDGGWQGLGQATTIAVTRDADNIKEGTGALKVSYSITKGGLAAALLPVQDGLAGVKSLDFWVKADQSEPMIVMLQEKDAGRYTSIFTAPANRWQHVQIPVSEFALSDGANDPKDADGKLDLDQVTRLVLIDASGLTQGAEADARVWISRLRATP